MCIRDSRVRALEFAAVQSNSKVAALRRPLAAFVSCHRPLHDIRSASCMPRSVNGHPCSRVQSAAGVLLERALDSGCTVRFARGIVGYAPTRALPLRLSRSRLTGKWVRARYVAELHEIAAQYNEREVDLYPKHIQRIAARNVHRSARAGTAFTAVFDWVSLSIHR